MSAPLLELARVSKTFHRTRSDAVAAVRAVSLTVAAGETVALVGESGSGKSTLGRMALGLLRPDTGTVRIEGRPLYDLSGAALREVRTRIQPVFQDATAALNPRRTVLSHMMQAIAAAKGTAADAAAGLESVGLRPGAAYLGRYPHELSGGQRQRLTIARALAAKPRLIVADEPLSGADVSIRGQILNLLLDIRHATGIAYLLITHDISLAREFADRVAVMRAGELVEEGAARQVLSAPAHDYTRRLIAAVPALPRAQSRAAG